MQKIVIVGAGGFGREVAMLIGQINASRPTWKIVGFFDDDPSLQYKNCAGLKVLGGVMELNKLREKLSVVLAVGSPQAKRSIFERLNNPFLRFPTLIHPGVLYPQDSAFGLGCVICAGCILTVNILLGDFVTLNLGCTVGHDSRLGSFTSVMPGVCVSGEVTLGEAVYVGTGANILNGIMVGDESIVGAGALVNKSVPDYCTVVGVPARVIRCCDPAC